MTAGATPTPPAAGSHRSAVYDELALARKFLLTRMRRRKNRALVDAGAWFRMLGRAMEAIGSDAARSNSSTA